MSVEFRFVIILGSTSGQGGFFVAVSSGDFDIHGTEFADTLIGYTGEDVIHGYGGSDKLYGQKGDDRLIGGSGTDLLNGGSGDDIMKGGAGADIYRISSSGDVIDEGSSIGPGDTVYSPLSANLATKFGGDVENAHLLGAAGRQVAGNGLDNGLFGNDGDNRLEGKAGDDKLNGFGGDDVLAGGSGSDVLRGGLGDDFLVGGLGDDRLVGGPGADRFVINVLGARDVITDFDASDRIILTAIDADFGEAGNQAFSFIGGAVFTGKAGELRFAVGELQGDVNGDGISDFSVGITLIDSMVLSASDIAL